MNGANDLALVIVIVIITEIMYALSEEGKNCLEATA